jgi:hypothetical protein
MRCMAQMSPARAGKNTAKYETMRMTLCMIE